MTTNIELPTLSSLIEAIESLQGHEITYEDFDSEWAVNREDVLALIHQYAQAESLEEDKKSLNETAFQKAIATLGSVDDEFHKWHLDEGELRAIVAKATARADAATVQQEELVEVRRVLNQIADQESNGRCSVCAMRCGGCLECDCRRGSWEPVPPHEMARETLAKLSSLSVTGFDSPADSKPRTNLAVAAYHAWLRSRLSKTARTELDGLAGEWDGQEPDPLACLDKPEVVEAVANAIQAVIERPDNWESTEYSSLANAAITAIRRLAEADRPEDGSGKING